MWVDWEKVQLLKPLMMCENFKMDIYLGCSITVLHYVCEANKHALHIFSVLKVNDQSLDISSPSRLSIYQVKNHFS